MELSKVLQHFQIEDKNYQFNTLSNGLINDTYLVSTLNEPLYILQKINIEVFTNYKALLRNIELVLPKLTSKHYKEVKLVAAKDGNYFKIIEEKEVWRLMTFIKDSVVFNTTTNPKVASEAGRIIGEFHKLLAENDTKDLKITLDRFHSIAYRKSQFDTALSSAKETNKTKAKESINFVQKNIDFLLKLEVNNLPQRTCHNDTKLNNILFDVNNKALCLIDLDTIMPGLFLFDFGDAIRTIVNQAPEDEKDLSKINFSKELFQAFIDGLAPHQNIFSQQEKETMPIGVVLMPFLHGIRALTDYLENNKYYKVSYETQNLDRAKSLFQFANLALQNQDFMLKVIQKKMC